MKVLIAGGADSLVWGNLRRKLQDHGLFIKWHVEHDPLDDLPAGCEGVILVKDMIGHMLHDKAVALAKARGLPNARIIRKWSHALPLLRATGFINAAPPSKKAPTPEETQAVVLEYLIGQRLQQDRTPTIAETAIALKRAFGQDMGLQRSQYQALAAQAAVEVPLAEPVAPPEPKHTESEIHEWAMVLAYERPEVMLDPYTWRSQVCERLLAAGEKEDPAALPDGPFTRARNEYRETVLRDKEWGSREKLRWLKRQFIAFREGRCEFPLQVPTQTKAVAIFGSSIQTQTISAVRVEVFGDKARYIVTAGEAYRHLLSAWPKRPMTYAKFLGLLQDGSIWAYPTSKTYYTSEVAVDEYFDRLDGLVVPAPEAPAPTPEPVAEAAALTLVVEEAPSEKDEPREKAIQQVLSAIKTAPTSKSDAPWERVLTVLEGLLAEQKATRVALEALAHKGFRISVTPISDSGE